MIKKKAKKKSEKPELHVIRIMSNTKYIARKRAIVECLMYFKKNPEKSEVGVLTYFREDNKQRHYALRVRLQDLIYRIGFDFRNDFAWNALVPDNKFMHKSNINSLFTYIIEVSNALSKAEKQSKKQP